MTEQALRGVVLMIRGRLVDGPDGYLGGYKAALPAGPGDAAVAALKANDVVLSVSVEYARK